MSTADVLAAAAEKAAGQPSVRKAVEAAWSACHADPELIGAVFETWCKSEDYGHHPSGLSGVLNRRYGTPAQVADSLRRAAATPPVMPEHERPVPEDEFTHMTHEQLLAQVRKWHWNAQERQRRLVALRPAADALVADMQKRLDRVWALVDHKRKTVPMDDLRAALSGEGDS